MAEDEATKQLLSLVAILHNGSLGFNIEKGVGVILFMG